jgi:hypothetical protein
VLTLSFCRGAPPTAAVVSWLSRARVRWISADRLEEQTGRRRVKGVLPQHEGHASSTVPRLGSILLSEVHTTQEIPPILHDASRWPHPHQSDTPCVLLSCTLTCLGLGRSLEHHLHAHTGQVGTTGCECRTKFAIRLIRFCRTVPLTPVLASPRTVSASPRMGECRGDGRPDSLACWGGFGVCSIDGKL